MELEGEMSNPFSSMKLRVVSYPDPILSEVLPDEIPEPGAEARRIGKKMLKLMKRHTGIGLSANQVGLRKRIIVIGCSREWSTFGKFICLRPEIIETSNETEVEEEGCVSIRIDGTDVAGPVERYKWCLVRYLDEFGEMKEHRVDGFLARVFQHEIDHLNGIQIIDRWDEETMEANQEKLQTLRDLGANG